MVMIRNWHYDSGEPYYAWSDPRQPCWRGQIYLKDFDVGKTFQNWLSNNLKQYDIDFRFNSGDPCYFIKIYDEHEALTFWMTWSE